MQPNVAQLDEQCYKNTSLKGEDQATITSGRSGKYLEPRCMLIYEIWTGFSEIVASKAFTHASAAFIDT